MLHQYNYFYILNNRSVLFQQKAPAMHYFGCKSFAHEIFVVHIYCFMVSYYNDKDFLYDFNYT